LIAAVVVVVEKPQQPTEEYDQGANEISSEGSRRSAAIGAQHGDRAYTTMAIISFLC
jgi:hypothetical protein